MFNDILVQNRGASVWLLGLKKFFFFFQIIIVFEEIVLEFVPLLDYGTLNKFLMFNWSLMQSGVNKMTYSCAIM